MQPNSHQPPADADVAPLPFPDRLYGRDHELAALAGAFAEVSAGAGRVVLLPGRSGSGKTALVQALRQPIQEKNGFFLEGKFNQYQSGIPLFALRQALQQLARETRAAAATDRDRWIAQVREAVGELGRLLTDLAPEWGALLGPQPAVPDISPFEAPHRFASVLRRFLSVFCRAEHPVVLFVDDWQWADAASLAVLQQLQVDSALRYLLVIAAYREEEVGPAHPFAAALDELRRQAVPVATLPVRDLGPADVRGLLGDTLKPAAGDLEPLATFLHVTTHGNPFFLRALLESLHARRALRFDPQRQCWSWDGQSLVAQDGPSDVVQLFVWNLGRLPAGSCELLALAACLGNRFELELLAIASGLPPAVCRERLQPALAQRVIGPVPGEPGQFLFQHDRVQQAAHSLIPADQLPDVRLKIARLLLEQLSPHQLQDRLLEVADHFNAGRARLGGSAEQQRLVELNIAAGRQARVATAYRAALQFHRVAGECLGSPGIAEPFWHDHHALALQFFKDWAESEFIEGDQDRAAACIQEALTHARTPLEEADVLCVLIVQNTLLARYPDAIAAGRRALAALGVTLPESDFEAARDAEIAQVRGRLAGRDLASLRDVPPMSDPTTLMVTRVLITLGPPCYRAHQRLWSVLVPRVVDLTLQHGPVPQIGYSHTAFGGLLGWVDNDYVTAREFGELATSLMHDVFPSPSDQSVFHLMMGSSTRHWFGHLRAASDDYARAWEAGLRSGNLQYAAYAFGHNMYCRFYQGVPLDRLIEESERSLAFSRSRTNQWAIDLLEGGLQIFGTLAGRAPAAAWQEGAYLQAVDAHHNIQIACVYRVLKAFSRLILGDPEQALAISEEAGPLIYTVGTQGLLPWPEHAFTRLLILAALHPQAGASRQAAWREEMDRTVARLEVWARHAPENYEFKLALARAEIAALEGRPQEALGLYEAAREAAHAGKFTQWEAWAQERAASLALAGGESGLAQACWQGAYFAYHRWGAMAKVALLEEQLLAPPADARPAPASARRPLEQHLAWLREQAARMTAAALPAEHSGLVKELAQAAEHLREEVARRKEAESELHQRRDQLAREIEARTRDLETTRELALKADFQARQLAEQHRGLLEAQSAMLNLVEDATAARDRAEQANAAQQESELRRSLALDAARMGTWDWEVASGRVTCCRTHEALLGYAPGAFPGTYEAFVSRVHPDDRLRMQQAGEQAAHCRCAFQFEYRVLWPDGRERWMSSHGRPIFDQAGNLVRMVGVLSDITERKAQARRDQLHLRTLQLLATGAPVAEVLDSIILLLEHGHEGWIGSIMLVDRSGSRLYCGSAPRLPEFFREGINDVAIGEHVGSCGAAVATRQMVMIEDVATHPNWSAFRELTARAGLRACWSMPILSANGQPLGALAVYRTRPALPVDEDLRTMKSVLDLAGVAINKKAAEEALQESKHRLEMALDAGQMGVWEYDFTTAKHYWSPELVRNFRLPPGEPSHATLQRFLHPDDVQIPLAALDAALAARRPYHCEYRLLVEGRACWVEDRGEILRDDRGEPLKVVGTAQDITERKQAEERLAQEATRRRVLIECSRDGIVVLDEDGAVNEANRQFAESLGYTLEEVRRLHVWDWDRHWPRDRVLEAIRALGPEGAHFETRHWRKDGSSFDVDLSNSVVELAGRKLVFCVCRDITERKRVEEERELNVLLLGHLNARNNLRDLMQAVTGLLHERCGCEAVGIRLRDGDDYPYFETRGFPPEFVQRENQLCLRDAAGQLVRDAHGDPVLECMCGNVLCGRFTPQAPGFTQRGSFWMNDPSPLPARLASAQGKRDACGRCVEQGYESLALIALRAGGVTLGLVQLNDRRPNRFTPERLAVLERLADSLAIGLAHRLDEARLSQSEEQFRAMFELASIGMAQADPADGRLLRVNRKLCEITGYPESELLRLRLPDLSHPEDRARDWEWFQQAVSGAVASVQHEERYVRKDGTLAWANVNMTVIRDADGSPERTMATIEDITERKRAVQALAEREEIFSSVVRQATDAVAIFDAGTGRFVEFNAAAHEGLGYTREEFAGLGIADFQAEHSDEVIRENIAAVQRQGSTEFESRHRHRDGGLRDVRVRIQLLNIRDRDYMAAVWTDITEQKRAEARAARDAQRTEFLLEFHQRAPQLADQELYDHVLERAVQLTGSVLGFFHQVSDDQNTILLTTWNREALQNCTATFDSHYPLKDAGNWVDCVRLQRPVIYNDYAHAPNQRGLPAGHAPLHRFMSIPVIRDGKVRIIFGVGNKATDYGDDDLAQLQVVANELHKLMNQRQAQRQLRASEERFRHLVETTYDWIWEVDAEARYTYASPRVSELLGYAPEEILGRTPFDFMTEAEARRVSGTFLEIASRRQPFAGLENVNRHRDGHEVVLETSGAPVLGAGGELLGYRGMDRDVTERKRLERERQSLEAQMRQQQRLESIGTLASGVAHEINNPITGVMNYAQLIQDRLPGDSPLAEFTSEIMRETQRVAAIVRNLLTFSRNEKQSHSPARIEDITNAVLSLVRTVIRRDQIALHVQVPPDLPKLNCRSQQIQQVIMNLVTNARDALNERYPGPDPDKVMRLEASRIARAGGGWIRITVEDHGAGIAPEVRERMFDPFFTTKGRDAGTGLGLSISHGIVKEHHGEWTVESEPGRFTRMHVDLPVEDGPNT